MRIRSYRGNDLAACRSLWAEVVQRHRDIYDDQSIGGSDPGLEFDKHLHRIGQSAIWVEELENGVAGFTEWLDQSAPCAWKERLHLFGKQFM